MKNFVYISLLIILLGSCSGLQVVNVKYAEKINKNYFVYALPRNIVAVDIEITEVRSYKGPYSAYAEKYMGITTAPKTDNLTYFISNSSISLLSEPDSNNYYFIFPKGKKQIKNVALNDQNIILGINCTGAENKSISVSNTGIFDVRPFPATLYTELSQSEYFKEHIDTIYKQVKIDTNWVRVPVQKKIIDTISVEGKAKEAAHHIMRLRKRVFKLLSGAYNKLPEVHSTDAIINELRREEEEYLSLFIGKTYTRTIHQKFYYTPLPGKENKQIIAYLHPEKGIVTDKSVKTLPLVLDVKSSNTLSPLDSALYKFKKASKKQGIVYRIPELANIKLSIGNTMLVEKQYPLAQFGTLNSLPINTLKQKNSSVMFDLETGNISKIE